jgi:hypothetical protein
VSRYARSAPAVNEQTYDGFRADWQFLENHKVSALGYFLDFDDIEDAYAGISGKFGLLKLGATYHDFQAEDSSEDFGNQLDLVVTWPFSKNLTFQAKYADVDSDSDRFADTEKIWFTAQFKI